MKTAFLVASLLMASSCGLAQVDTARAGGIETRSRSAVFGSDCAKAVQAAGYIFSSPARWQGGSWLAAGGVLAATAGASLLDNDLRSAMLRSRTHTNDQIEKVVVHYGEASVVLLTSTGA